jgi:hypothetical protein
VKRPFLICGLAVGGLLMLGPVVATLGTAYQMHHAFQEMGRVGVGDPKQLSAAIGEILVTGIAGIIVFVIGLALAGGCIIALVRQQGRTPPSFDSTTSDR